MQLQRRQLYISPYCISLLVMFFIVSDLTLCSQLTLQLHHLELSTLQRLRITKPSVLIMLQISYLFLIWDLKYTSKTSCQPNQHLHQYRWVFWACITSSQHWQLMLFFTLLITLVWLLLLHLILLSVILLIEILGSCGNR